VAAPDAAAAAAAAFLRAMRASRTGRRLITSGSTSKFHAGGGDDVAHSSVLASHGSSGAVFGARMLMTKLIMNTVTEMAITNAPNVISELRSPQPRLSR
jgi:hypothetical protein